MLTIFFKELKTYFTSLLGYIPMFIFLALSGGFFFLYCVSTQSTYEIQSFFNIMDNVLLFVIAVLTIRVFVEERKLSTYELLLTSPVSPWEIILGKFLGVFAFVMIAVGVTLVYPLSVAFLTSVPWGVVLSGYLGIVLSVAFFISVGMFASSVTDNYVVAGLLSIGLSIVVVLVGILGTMAPTGDTRVLTEIFSDVSYMSHYQQFSEGVIRVKDIVYFIIGTFVWLYLSKTVVEARMWK